MTIRSVLLAGLLAVATLPVATALADEPAPRTVSVSGTGRGVGAARHGPRDSRGAGPPADDGRGTQGGRDDRGPGPGALQGPQDRPEVRRMQPGCRSSLTTAGTRSNRKQVLLGYIVSRQVEVEVRDLDQLGPLHRGAVSAGVNQVGDPAARLDAAQGTRTPGNDAGRAGRPVERRDAGAGGRSRAGGRAHDQRVRGDAGRCRCIARRW